MRLLRSVCFVLSCTLFSLVTQSIVARIWNRWQVRSYPRVYPNVSHMLIYGTPASWYVDDEYDGGIRQDLEDI